MAGVSAPTHLPPQHSDCRLQTWDWAAENTTSSLSPSPPPSQLPADNTIYTAVQRRVEAEHQSFELIPLILSAQLMDMVQLSTARSFNISCLRISHNSGGRGEIWSNVQTWNAEERNCEYECWICTVSPPGTAVYCTNYTLVSCYSLALLHSTHLMAASHSPIKSCVHHCQRWSIYIVFFL